MRRIVYSITVKHEGLHGLYIRAFCQGLHQVLEPYRQRLVSLEQELIADPHLTLSYIQSCVDEYQDLFPVLSAIVNQLRTHKVWTDRWHCWLEHFSKWVFYVNTQPKFLKGYSRINVDDILFRSRHVLSYIVLIQWYFDLFLL